MHKDTNDNTKLKQNQSRNSTNTQTDGRIYLIDKLLAQSGPFSCIFLSLLLTNKTFTALCNVDLAVSPLYITGPLNGRAKKCLGSFQVYHVPAAPCHYSNKTSHFDKAVNLLPAMSNFWKTLQESDMHTQQFVSYYASANKKLKAAVSM